MFSSFLVVCTGNICRSPMGEAFLKARLRGTRSVAISSAGIAAVVSSPAHEHAATVMAEKGLDLTAHTGKQLSLALAREYDLLFVMDAEQQGWIGQHHPELHGRVYRLGHWLDCDVPDPIGRSLETFRASRDLIEEAVDSWLERLK